jgi:2-dehydropantoate 2-reductase
MQPFYVVGAGGIGCVVGYALHAAGMQVVFVEKNRKKVEVARRRREPVQIRDRSGNLVGSCAAEFLHFDEWEPKAGSWVVLCTKCYDNAAVLERLTVPVRLLPIQNGFDPQLAAHGHESEGIASFVSECLPGEPVTRITRPGALHILNPSPGPSPEKGGEETPPSLLGKGVGGLGSDGKGAGALSRFLRVRMVPRIEPIKYAKLMYNAAISPLAAAAGIDNGRLLSVPIARRLFFGLLQENDRILTTAGIELGKVGPFHPRTVAWILRRRWLASLMARGFEPSLRGTYCSMAGEIEKGRTEIDNYNGHLIRLAEQTGSPCRLNRVVYDLVARMTRDRQSPHIGVLDELTHVISEPEGMTGRQLQRLPH